MNPLVSDQFGAYDDDRDPTEEDYRQHRVNVKVQLDQSKIDMLSSTEMQYPERVIWPGTQAKATFNLHTWEIGFSINDQYTAEGDSIPKILTALNGYGSDELAMVKASGEEHWLSKLIAMRIRYVGHPTGEWNSEIGKLQKNIGAQIQGVRPFLAFETAPIHSLIAWYVPTMTEAAELLADQNKPEGVGQVKVGLIVKPYTTKDVWDLFHLENEHYLENPEKYKQAMGIKYQRTKRSVQALSVFHDFALTCGISMIESFVRDGLLTVNIPNTAPYSVLNKTGTLTQEETENYLLGFASKTELLPHSHYQALAGVNNDERTNKFFAHYRTILLRSMFEPKNLFYMFGFNRQNGGRLEGLDPRSNTIKKGTPHGDMIETIHNSARYAFAAMSDFIYNSTRNILGRVIKPARKGAFGSFI